MAQYYNIIIHLKVSFNQQEVVEVIKKSNKRKRLEEKTYDLYFFTLKSQTLKSIEIKRFKRDEITNYIYIGDPIWMVVDVEHNSVRILNPDYFDIAFELAKEYEEHTKKGWTLEPDYSNYK